jgi:hypothetical protein
MHHWLLKAKAPSPVFPQLKEVKPHGARSGTIEVEKHPSTLHSKLLAHTHTHTVVDISGHCHANKCSLKLIFWDARRQAFPCISPYWNILIKPMKHNCLPTEEDFQNQILWGNIVKTSWIIQKH